MTGPRGRAVAEEVSVIGPSDTAIAEVAMAGPSGRAVARWQRMDQVAEI